MNLKKFNREVQEEEKKNEEIPVTNGILSVDTDESGNTLVLLSGKIDANNFQDIQRIAFELLDEKKVQALTFDMYAVTYVSSAGLRMFSAVNQKSVENGVSYKLTRMRESTSKLFQLTGYASAFCIEVVEE